MKTSNEKRRARKGVFRPSKKKDEISELTEQATKTIAKLEERKRYLKSQV